jgi:hypothetical protein
MKTPVAVEQLALSGRLRFCCLAKKDHEKQRQAEGTAGHYHHRSADFSPQQLLMTYSARQARGPHPRSGLAPD